MSDLREYVLLAFGDELYKQAGVADVIARAAPRLKNIGALGGAGATLGALGGAGVGAVHGYRESRAQGGSVGDAVVGGLGGALGGAGHGAMLGGIVGMGGGALAKQDFSGLAQRGGVLGAGARFGQRQVHSLTGMLSPQELEGVRGGAWGARQALSKANETAREGGAAKALAATEAATGMGPKSMNLTSVPGYLGAVKEHGLSKVLHTGAREQLTSGGAPLAALAVGLPAISAAKTLASKEETDEAGRGKGERLGESLGRTVGGVAGGVMPVIGQEVVGRTLGAVGRVAGRGLDKLRGKSGNPGMAPSTLEPTEGQHTPSERITSPAAAGQQTDIGL